MKDSQQEKDEYFIYTQQIATELHEKDDLIYRSPNKVQYGQDLLKLLKFFHLVLAKGRSFLFILTTVIFPKILAINWLVFKKLYSMNTSYFYNLDSWWVFNTVIIIAILLNCVQLALAQYLPNGDRASNADFLDATEPYFLLIFVFEMVVKILAHGFALHGGSYLRDGWNIMDFVVVSTGLLEAYGLG